MLSMYVHYCYRRKGPHTLYYNDRHAFLFLSLSLSIIKMHPKFSSLTRRRRLWLKENKKDRIYVKFLFMKKLQTQFHQNRTRNKEVISLLVMRWKSQKIRKFCFQDPQFSTFLLFIVILKVHDERNRMTFCYQNRPFSFRDIQGAESPPHQLTYSRKPTSNRVKIWCACTYEWFWLSTSTYPRLHPKTINAITLIRFHDILVNHVNENKWKSLFPESFIFVYKYRGST